MDAARPTCFAVAQHTTPDVPTRPPTDARYSDDTLGTLIRRAPRPIMR